jgi:hypothetical protein
MMMISILFLYNSDFINGYIPFNPTTPVELHPGNLRLCGNCKEALETPNGGGLVCRLFGKIDPVWGKINYDSCSVVRSNSSQCGSIGRYSCKTDSYLSFIHNAATI